MHDSSTKTKKVVINVCFGGFSISLEALYWLIQKGSDIVEVMTVQHYYGKNWQESYEKDLAKMKEFRDGYMHEGFMPRILFKDKKVYSLDNSKRDHPDLVAVVETLKEKANGRCAKLKVVEIPADAEWEIDEYDGNESIDEVHRSWS